MATTKPVVLDTNAELSQILTGDTIAPEYLGTGTRTGLKFLRDDGSWQLVSGGGGGATAFTALTDVPSSYTGKQRQLLRVNNAENGVEFVVDEQAITVDWDLTRCAFSVLWVSPTAIAIPEKLTRLTATDAGEAPVAGQTVLLNMSNGTDNVTGVYVLGSVADRNNIPITRHPDWPATRVLTAPVLFHCRRSCLHINSGQSVSISTTAVSLALSRIKFSSELLVNSQARLYFFSIEAGAAMPAPLAYNVPYRALPDPNRGDHQSCIIYNWTGWAQTSGTEITLTTSGVDASGGSFAGYEFICPLSLYAPSRVVLMGRPTPAPQASYVLGTDTFNVVSSVQSRDETIFNEGVALGGGSATPRSIAIGDGARATGESSFNPSISQGQGALSESGGIAIGNSTAAAAYGLALGQGSISEAFGIAISGQAHFDAVALNTSTLAPGMFSEGHAVGDSASTGDVAQIGTHRVRMYASTTGAETKRLAHGKLTTQGIGLVMFNNVRFDFDLKIVASGDTASCEFQVRGHALVIDGNGVLDAQVELLSHGGTLADVGKLKVKPVLIDATATEVSWVLKFEVTGLTGQTVNWLCEGVLTEFTSLGYYKPVDTEKVRRTDGTTAIASEALGVGKFVSLWVDSGVVKVRLADGASLRAADGYVTRDYTAGEVVEIKTAGENSLLSGLTLGPVYLGSSGSVVSTAPTSGSLFQRLGFAVSTSRMVFQREMAITLP